MDALRTIIVFDTNVLLTNPMAILEYPKAEIVIPEAVLSELDKLKTARVDPDLRFRGREVSRLIFELAAGGSLIEGVDLPDGGRLRVAPLEANTGAPGTHLPDGFTTRTSDDKILATAYLLDNDKSISGQDKDGNRRCEVTLITNDLNLLLKAQAYDLKVQQYGSGDDISFGKRYIVRPFQRYRASLTILGISLAVFVAVVVLLLLGPQVLGQNNATSTALPTEVRALLTAEQEAAYAALEALKQDPSDVGALKTLADFYYDRVEFARSMSIGDGASILSDAKKGIEYYERYLAYRPKDGEARNDMATLYFYSGNTDRAIQEVAQVLKDEPNHIAANLNLGTFYLYGRRDFDAARAQMNKVIELTKSDAGQQHAFEMAQQALILIDHEEAAIRGRGGATGGDSGTGAEGESEVL